MFYRSKLEGTSGKIDLNVEHKEVHPLDANLISSERGNGKHTLMLDLDIRSHYVKSTTFGHAHLYVDTDLSLADMQEIVDVLAKHGIVQQGINKQIKRGFLAMRPPGNQKDHPFDDADLETAKEMIKPVSIKFKTDAESAEQSLNVANKTMKQILQDNMDAYSLVQLEQWALPIAESTLSHTIHTILDSLNMNELMDSVMLYKQDNTDDVVIKVNDAEFATIVDKYTYITKYLMFKQGDFDYPEVVNSNWPTWKQLKEVLESFKEVQ